MPITSCLKKAGKRPREVNSVSLYIILHFLSGCKGYLPESACRRSLPYIDEGRGVFPSRNARAAQKTFLSRVLTFSADLAIMYPLLLKAANCICGSAGIGRQARLRGVCCMTYGFKSHLPHHFESRVNTRLSYFFLSPQRFFPTYFSRISVSKFTENALLFTEKLPRMS